MAGDCEVAVIGAGAAGLAAGRALREAGADVLVLEASDRTGGRAFTDTTTFSQPWDLGCHWLHSADVNPFVAIADRLGFRYRTAPSRLVRNLRLGDRWAGPEEIEAADVAVERAFDEVRAAGEAGRDVAAVEALSDAGPWNGLVRHWLALMTASSPERISTRDFAAYSGTDYNWPVIDGYGALVRAYGAEIPVVLGCPVSRIDRSGPRLRLSTPKGEVSARSVIVTVSTAVISEGRLAFTPDLPTALGEAFAGMTLGVAEKVAIGFGRDVFGFQERTGVTVYGLGRAPVNFQILPGEQPVAVGHMAGDPAATLLGEGSDAMGQYVLSALAEAFGADIRRDVTRLCATGWARDPFIGGGYSGALPGKAHMRARLLDPLDERIFFAGEAVCAHDFSTCHGAHLSGLAAARRSLAFIHKEA